MVSFQADRPERLNALNPPLMRALVEAAEEGQVRPPQREVNHPSPDGLEGQAIDENERPQCAVG